MRESLSGDTLTVLAFHGVGSAEHFGRQLDALSAHCHFVDAAAALHSLEHGTRLPNGATLLTFDDGERSVLTHARECLNERSIRAVMFPVVELLGTQLPFWWHEAAWLVEHGACRTEGRDPPADSVVRQLKSVPDGERHRRLELMREAVGASAPPTRQLDDHELQLWLADGHELGNHTFTHPWLSGCRAAEVDDEIRRAHARLAEIMGREPALFAYPGGVVADSAIPVLRRLGYRLAFLFDHRLASWPPTDPYRVSRLRVNSTDSIKRLQLSVSGLHPAIDRFRTEMRARLSR